MAVRGEALPDLRPVAIATDPTDLVALLALLLAWVDGRRRLLTASRLAGRPRAPVIRMRRRMVAPLVLAVAATASIATSAATGPAGELTLPFSSVLTRTEPVGDPGSVVHAGWQRDVGGIPPSHADRPGIDAGRPSCPHRGRWPGGVGCPWRHMATCGDAAGSRLRVISLHSALPPHRRVDRSVTRASHRLRNLHRHGHRDRRRREAGSARCSWSDRTRRG